MRVLPNNVTKRDHSCILCYSGSKHRYLKEIYEILPYDEELKVLDMFAGGGSLSTHLPTDYQVTANDYETRVINIHQHLQSELAYVDPLELEATIRINCRNKIKDNKDKEGYDKAKGIYNAKVLRGEMPDPMALFELTMASNTNYIRFNKAGEQTLQFGKRYYNSNSAAKMQNYLQRVDDRSIVWISKDYKDIDIEAFDLIILDPPYSYSGKSCATYNEQGGWQFKDMVEVLALLDRIHEAGKKFIFFNEVVTKGVPNNIMQQQLAKYNIHILKDTLSGCNYQRKDLQSVEVMVTNYDNPTHI